MAEFFVNRPIVAMVMAIFIVILGLVSLSGLPVAQYPEITPPMVQVSGTYTGANALNVEQSVATPVEQKVNGVEGMIYMTSTNSSDGRMSLDVSFEVGTDLNMANVLTQNKVSEAQSSLPEEVKRLGVPVKKKLSFPLLLVSLVSPNGTYDDEFLTNYATLNVVDDVARIRGVGLAEVLGGSSTDYAMRIWIRPDQLAKLNLTVPDITSAIQQQNVLVPAGQVGGEPAPAGTEFTYTVTTGGRFETAEEFGAVVVRANSDGSQVLLRVLSLVVRVISIKYAWMAILRHWFKSFSCPMPTVFKLPSRCSRRLRKSPNNFQMMSNTSYLWTPLSPLSQVFEKLLSRSFRHWL